MNDTHLPQESMDLAAARRVLITESESLAALRESLDGDFVGVLDLLSRVPGRVIVTGMGKSGHVARKIAATIASTGTPAQFVHPGEASHGDLGMIARGDAVIALSNSGKTPELSDIIAYTRRRNIPLIGITAEADSPLQQAADATLLLPRVPEACPMGLAPTTSTTMMMALGDALAVALFERKGFTADQFQDFHPGGTLGRKLLRVADVMHGADELPLCTPDVAMAEAIIVMTNKTFGCTGVVAEDGALIGIITDGDLRRHMQPELLAQRAGDIMTAHPRTIGPQALAAEALGVMNAKSITSLFVVEEIAPLGIVRMHDCLRAGV